MGVNNQQRRAAKKRQRARRAGSHQGTEHRRAGDTGFADDGREAEDRWLDFARWQISMTFRRLSRRRGSVTDAEASDSAKGLLLRLASAPADVVAEMVLAVFGEIAAEVLAGGWSIADLEEMVRRRAGEHHVWVLKQSEETVGRGVDGVASALLVATLLAKVPLGAAASTPAATDRGAAAEASAKKLATVRSLLAKAERTSFDDEAEALSAKAQELISRHALERLLAEDADPGSGPAPVTTGRIWLDNPYLMAKAALVAAVAEANRCRCVVSEELGLCSVVGDPPDLDAVQLLSTSLMVQANRSMLRHGRHIDQRGVSRTRSFRQSFLVSFAHRIGERLQEVNEAAVRETGPGTDLVPVLQDQHERVEAAFEAFFPHVVQTETSVSNGQGWAAGHAAADDALIDLRGQVTR